MRCPRCSEIPSALDFVGHVERVHFGHGAVRWACQHCHYNSHSLNDAIAHCLVLKHDPQSLRLETPEDIFAVANHAMLLLNENDPPPSSARIIEPILYSPSIRTYSAYQYSTEVTPSDPPLSPTPSAMSTASGHRTPRRSRRRARKLPSPEAPPISDKEKAPDAVNTDAEEEEPEEDEKEEVLTDLSMSLHDPLGEEQEEDGVPQSSQPSSPPESTLHTPGKRQRHTCTCPNCKEKEGVVVAHSEKWKHNCHYPDCGRAYVHSGHLRDHLKGHEKERAFGCDYDGCGKTFVLSDRLIRHMKSHTGNREFVCPQCSKGFIRSDTLTGHLKTHAKDALR